VYRPLALETLEDRLLLTTYTITELGTGGGRQSFGYSLNDGGTSVGKSQPQGIRYFHAAEWNTAGTKTDLGVLGNNKFSIANGINNTGFIAGSSNYATNPTLYHAFRWDPGTQTMTDLGVLPGATSPLSFGQGINSTGSVAGYSSYSGAATDKYHAFRWDSGTQMMTDLGTLGGDDSRAYAVNNGNIVVGSSMNGSSSYNRAFKWSGGVMTDLGLLQQWSQNGTPVGAEAYGVNNLGDVAGGSFYVAGIHDTAIWHGAIWKAGGTVVDLGNLGQGGDWSQAFDVNDGGLAVGWANTTFGDSPKHAFVWYGSGSIQDLNNLLVNGGGWLLTSATKINSSGQIVGYGTHNGLPRGFLLTPTAAPGSDGGGHALDPASARALGAAPSGEAAGSLLNALPSARTTSSATRVESVPAVQSGTAQEVQPLAVSVRPDAPAAFTLSLGLSGLDRDPLG
jgi:probable HAF family extracellular repeat protein